MNTLSIRIEDTVKEKLAAYGAPRGLKPTQVARMFLHQTINALEPKASEEAASVFDSEVSQEDPEAAQ